MDARLIGSLFRLRRLAAEFGHFWAYGIEAEDLAEIWHRSADFAEFKKNLSEVCLRKNVSPVGGRYLEDAVLENGWLTAVFGGNDQLRAAIHPEQKLVQVGYVNGTRHTSAVYSIPDEELIWENPPSAPRDAVRVLKVIAVLAEYDPKFFVNAHLPNELNNGEAHLYTNLPSWSHLWISPSVLENIIPTR